MRFLCVLFNFAIAQYEDGSGHSVFRENPVMRLTQTRAWYRVDRRQTVIKPHQLVGEVCGHCGRHPQRLVDAHPVVPDGIERDHVDVADELLRERIRQAGKAPVAHADRKV